MSLFARSGSLMSLLATALLALAPHASAATPGLVQGANGWYEDIRFFTPGTAEVPTRVGVATPSGCAAYGCGDELSFNTVTAQTLSVAGYELLAPGSSDVVSQPDVIQSYGSGFDWQGLGVGDRWVGSNEGLQLRFTNSVDLVGLTVFYSGQLPPAFDLVIEETNFALITTAPTNGFQRQGSITQLGGGINQIQWWFFDQPFSTSSFDLMGTGGSAYHLGAVQIAAVPEPGAVAMAVTGLMVVGWAAARRRQRPA